MGARGWGWGVWGWITATQTKQSPPCVIPCCMYTETWRKNDNAELCMPAQADMKRCKVVFWKATVCVSLLKPPTPAPLPLSIQVFKTRFADFIQIPNDCFIVTFIVRFINCRNRRQIFDLPKQESCIALSRTMCTR